MSLLNIDMMVSASIKRTGHFGSIQWDGRDPEIVNLKFIPPHVKPVKGDTIVTSGYNAIFPEGIVIGVIDDVKLADAALFYELDVKLMQDFRKLSFVTVVKSQLKQEQDSLEQVVTPPQK
jgi:rod shape-determining protein MreC